MVKRLRRLVTVLLLVALAAGAFFAFHRGLVPARFSPLPLLSLDHPGGILIGWQLASLKGEPELCRQVLLAPKIEAVPVSDRRIENGCGLINGFRLSQAGGARLSVDAVTCPLAAALALWVTYEVQPQAQALLGQRVTAIQHMGSYSCRNIIGSARWHGVRSEHATANALDVSGFTLADGRRITVERNWRGDGPESAFLKAVHRGACRYFRVALGPDFNAAHRDHFHLDRGNLWTCG